MKLAILETGRPPGDLAMRFGNYPSMFAQMLGPQFEIESFDLAAGQLPSGGGHDALLITGSPAGVYEDLPWIPALLDFIRSAGNRKMVGICFGHQAMAEALGGKVEKSDKGWGAGLHSYSVEHAEPWMDSAAEISAPASHQDQVVIQPPRTEITVASNFTPYAGLAWTDRPAISFQFHPEFEPAFAKALITERYDRVPNPEAAIASLDQPNDNHRIADWIRRFLTSNGESE
ncbi:type 1 glutamine amidotransferase [Sphingomonas alba]|uniref:Type 1 glutamine amidotransferase n=1 Tax=Sphingomonas alba TaxID=2908208 RepID=A0ABT0RPZ7_9SPHN|nr:type 1 glutamine amidotransferase [Sphingomonas alba]MCL6684721.1 type 1 glutamine amidotransferase [Sphingomonas alba]